MRGYGRGERGLGNARRDWDLPTPIITSLSSSRKEENEKEEEETKQQSSSSKPPFPTDAISSTSHREIDTDVEMEKETHEPLAVTQEQQQQPQSINESMLLSSASPAAAHAQPDRTTTTTPAILTTTTPYEDDDHDDIFASQILPMKRPPPAGNMVQQHPPPPPPSTQHIESLQQQPVVNAPVPLSLSFSKAVERPKQSHSHVVDIAGNAARTLDWFHPSRDNEMHLTSDNITVSNPPSVASTVNSSLASVATQRSTVSSSLMPPPTATDPNSIVVSSGNPFSTSTAAKKYNHVPKSELHCLYGKRRKVISSESYHTWHNGGQAHSLKWTSIFVCPITGELFLSGRYAGGEYTTTAASDGMVWYSKKLHAEHAAAARAYDCMTFRYPTLPLSSSVESLGQDIPYAATNAMFTVPPGIPSYIADKIRIQQNAFRHENGLPPIL
jgi:hypothetical protein